MGICWADLCKRVTAWKLAHNYTCDFCGREVFENERVCSSCEKVLPWNNGTFCPFCGRKEKEEGVCRECKYHRLSVQKARSVFNHEGEGARLVYRLKTGKKYLAVTAAELMKPIFEREFLGVDLLSFIPMTEKRQKQRGYNQAYLIAKQLSELTGVPVFCGVEKVHETEEQKQLGREEREKNLQDCFRVTDRAAVKGKKILLVDDTMTTGSTASALADRLKRAGAKEVDLITVTSVMDKPIPKERPSSPQGKENK